MNFVEYITLLLVLTYYACKTLGVPLLADLFTVIVFLGGVFNNMSSTTVHKYACVSYFIISVKDCNVSFVSYLSYFAVL